MSATTYLDAMADGDYGFEGKLDTDGIIDYISGEEEEVPSLPNPHATAALADLVTNFSVIELEDLHRKEFVDDALSLAIAHAENPYDNSVKALTQHRLKLGRLFGQLFVDVVPEPLRLEGFGQFEQWVLSIGACSEVVDSIWDLPEDFRTGKTTVEPSLKNRAMLAYHAMPEARNIMKDIRPRLAGKLAIKAVLFGVNRSGRFNKYRTR